MALLRGRSFESSGMMEKSIKKPSVNLLTTHLLELTDGLLLVQYYVRFSQALLLARIILPPRAGQVSRGSCSGRT
jgi:hypothetical protein